MSSARAPPRTSNSRCADHARPCAAQEAANRARALGGPSGRPAHPSSRTRRHPGSCMKMWRTAAARFGPRMGCRDPRHRRRGVRPLASAPSSPRRSPAPALAASQRRQPPRRNLWAPAAAPRRRWQRPSTTRPGGAVPPAARSAARRHADRQLAAPTRGVGASQPRWSGAAARTRPCATRRKRQEQQMRCPPVPALAELAPQPAPPRALPPSRRLAG